MNQIEITHSLEAVGFERTQSEALIKAIDVRVGRDHGEMATRSDIQALRSEMREMRGEIHGEMREMRGEIHSEIHSEMHEMRSEIHGEMREMRGEMREMATRGEMYRVLWIQSASIVGVLLTAQLAIAGVIVQLLQ